MSDDEKGAQPNEVRFEEEPTEVRFLPFSGDSPLGRANQAIADPEKVKLFAERLRESDLMNVAGDFINQPEVAQHFAKHWLGAGWWPQSEAHFAKEFFERVLEQFDTAIRTGKRPVTLVQQIPKVDRPWVSVVELPLEVLLLIQVGNRERSR